MVQVTGSSIREREWGKAGLTNPRMAQNIPAWMGELVGIVLAVSPISTQLLIASFGSFQIIIYWSVLGTNSRSAATFSDSCTKNMIEHLRDSHRIGKDGPIEATLEQGHVLLETAFGKTRQKNCLQS